MEPASTDTTAKEPTWDRTTIRVCTEALANEVASVAFRPEFRAADERQRRALAARAVRDLKSLVDTGELNAYSLNKCLLEVGPSLRTKLNLTEPQLLAILDSTLRKRFGFVTVPDLTAIYAEARAREKQDVAMTVVEVCRWARNLEGQIEGLASQLVRAKFLKTSLTSYSKERALFLLEEDVQFLPVCLDSVSKQWIERNETLRKGDVVETERETMPLSYKTNFYVYCCRAEHLPG
jgi:hypothetical protein